MPMNLTRKIISAHLTKPSDMNPGDEIYVKFDQTLTHDINAVMCYLALEGMGIKRVGELSGPQPALCQHQHPG